jgi:hypothetical protein
MCVISILEFISKWLENGARSAYIIFNDVGVAHVLEKAHFLQGFFLAVRVHLGKVDFFEAVKFLVPLVAHQKDLAKAPFAQLFDGDEVVEVLQEKENISMFGGRARGRK